MTMVSFFVPAILCEYCAYRVEYGVQELEGVKSVRADSETRKVEITFDTPADEQKIKSLLAEIAYPAAG